MSKYRKLYTNYENRRFKLKALRHLTTLGPFSQTRVSAKKKCYVEESKTGKQKEH
jgi:hypothetical protein